MVWIHGGGFVSGRRGDIENYLKVLAGEGFVVVNVDYTIAPTTTYPTPVRQFSRAVAYLDRNADPLGPQSVLFDKQLRAKGVKVASLFYPKDYSPPLSHEYQFNLDIQAGNKALERSVEWLAALAPQPDGVKPATHSQ